VDLVDEQDGGHPVAQPVTGGLDDRADLLHPGVQCGEGLETASGGAGDE
jgi:hypothetical protein